MRLLKRILFALLPRGRRRVGYGTDVLFAGWVDLPAAFREARRRRAGPVKPTADRI